MSVHKIGDILTIGVNRYRIVKNPISNRHELEEVTVFKAGTTVSVNNVEHMIAVNKATNNNTMLLIDIENGTYYSNGVNVNSREWITVDDIHAILKANNRTTTFWSKGREFTE